MQEARNKRWNAAIVVILKDEAPYLEDWILFHSAIGFEHFFVYDNGSTDGITEVLTKFIAGGILTHINWPVRAGQIDAYNHALCLAQDSCQWLGFFDVDEYVVLHEHEDILAFLNDGGADQVLLPWRNFPYGGHKSAPGGADIENYFWAHKGRPDVAVQAKHLVKCSAAVRVTAHYSQISTDKTIIADGTPSTPTHVVNGPSYRGAQVNHYTTRSYAENDARIKKGQVDGGAEKQVADFAPLTAESSINLEYDSSILRHYQKFALERERWAPVSLKPHRYGLMQRNPVLLSWNNVPYFFCKSYANYLAGRSDIAHGTDLNLIHVDAFGREHDLRTFWHTADLHSVHFRIDQQGFVPYFMGSVHYGDFVRRFGFEARFVTRDLNADDGWLHSLDNTGRCFAAIVDLETQTGLAIDVTVGEKVVAKVEIPAGRHVALIYDPSYRSDRTPRVFQINGSCRVRELIIGTMP